MRPTTYKGKPNRQGRKVAKLKAKRIRLFIGRMKTNGAMIVDEAQLFATKP